MTKPTREERHALDLRLVPSSFPARRFHIELTDVDLQGGGVIAGRVHRDGGWRAGPVLLRVRCVEAWRAAPPPGPIVLHTRGTGPPHWSCRVLWSDERDLGSLADVHWVRFRVELPAELPIAVEARSIAFRYEVEARRQVRFAPDELAGVTPLRNLSLAPSPAERVGRAR